MVTTVTQFSFRQVIAALPLAILMTFLATSTASAQSDASQAQTTWSPTRSKSTTSKTARRPQTKQNRNSQAVRPASQPKAESKQRGQVRQAQHSIPTPPPMHGEVIYDGAIIDGACDAMGNCGCGANGCDSIGCDGGCDSIGSCGPNCGCSLCGEMAGGRAWRPAVTLSLPQDGWVSFEAIHYWTDGMDLPPLVTQSPAGTVQGDAGVLSTALRPTPTTVLFGGGDVLDDPFDGGRLRFGFWLDRCHTIGIGAEYFELSRETETFSATSTGDPILARPFFNTLTGRDDAELVAFTDADTQLTGTVGVQAYSELAGGSFHVRALRNCSEGCREWLFCGCNGHYCTRSEFRLGYRYVELNEGVSITEDLTSGLLPSRGEFLISDNFDTENQFNGIELGWNSRIVRGYWSLEGLVRLAVGNTRQTVNIAGSTTITDQTDLNNPVTDTFEGGLLAATTNSGRYEQDEFSVLPEFNLILGYQLTDHLKATVGYTGLYWSNVVRPGQHIPTELNPDFLPPAVTSNGAARPLFAFDTTDYWAHGITYGLEYRW